jgi:hypothetical protein
VAMPPLKTRMGLGPVESGGRGRMPDRCRSVHLGPANSTRPIESG